MLNWIPKVILSAIALYLILIIIAFFAQRRLIYFPPDYYQPPPDGWTEVRTKSGYLGWHSPPQAGKPTVMVFHGNASSIDSNMHIFRDLQNGGYGVWSVGYPGYPGNSGTPSQAGLIEAAREQYAQLQRLDPNKIVFYGTSLGSGVAAHLAAHYPPEILILDAPFDSIADLAAQQLPVLPTRLLLKDKWESGRAIDELRQPLIWIHGTADSVIPITEGQKLYDGYKGPKTAHIIPGAHHTNTWLLGGRQSVLDALSQL